MPQEGDDGGESNVYTSPFTLPSTTIANSHHDTRGHWSEFRTGYVHTQLLT